MQQFRSLLPFHQLQWHHQLRLPLFRTLSTRKQSSSKIDDQTTIGEQAYHMRLRHDHLFKDKNDTTTASSNKPRMSTILAHAGIPPPRNPNDNTPLSPPLTLSTTYTRPASGTYNSNDSIYGRMHNETRSLLEYDMMRLELLSSTRSKNDYDGRRNAVFDHEYDDDDDDDVNACCYCTAHSSGMAAISTVLLSHPTALSSLHVILPSDVYHGVPSLLLDVLERQGVSFTIVENTSFEENVVRVIEEVRESSYNGGGGGIVKRVVLWIETPSNPLMKEIDIQKVSMLVRRYYPDSSNNTIIEDNTNSLFGITIVVDSTLAPPPITQPLLHGADISLHSATKYLNGHSDANLGLVTANPHTFTGRDLSRRLLATRTLLGTIPSPFDCYLTLRGLRTLHVRLSRMSENAARLIQLLSSHLHPRGIVLSIHRTRTQILSSSGGVFSFELVSESHAMAVAGAVRIFRRATSFGGTESCLEHRRSIEPEEKKVSPEGLLRVSVGLEDGEDLVEDLEMALRVAERLLG